MAQEIQRLSALAVTRASKPGLYADGAGLYLRVGRNGSKSWAFRFTLRGKPREMGLGGLSKVTLADARKKAADARLLLSDGRDPLDLRPRSMTFDKCAEAYIAVMNRVGEMKSTNSNGATQLSPTSRRSLPTLQFRTSIWIWS
jgi:Arm domain-containing DNA-binding protein